MSGLRLATSMFRRLKGLLGPPGAWDLGDELLIAPCHDIHTFGMRYAIDVAFLGADGVVLKVGRDVGPRHRMCCRGACAVVERKSAPHLPWYHEGDHVALVPADGSNAVLARQDVVPVCQDDMAVRDGGAARRCDAFAR